MKAKHHVVGLSLAALFAATAFGCALQNEDGSEQTPDDSTLDDAQGSDEAAPSSSTSELRWWRRRQRYDAGTGATPTPTPTADAGTTPMPTADAGTTPTPTPTPTPVASGRWVSAYYASYQQNMYPPSSIDWSGLSHLMVTRLKTDGGGRVQTDMDIDSVNGPALARNLASLAHQNGRKAILMLGGAGQGTGIRDSASAANRATFVANLLKAARDLGFDGIDLDWEDNLDMDSFIALAAALRSAAPAGFLLTAPGYPINPNIGGVDPKIPTLVSYLDQFNLMSYYPGTAFAGYGWLSWHNAPLSGWKAATPVTIEDSLARHVAAGIPKAKLGMGIAFYTICYTGGVTAPNQSTEGGVTIQGGDNAMPLSWFFGSGGPYNALYRKWDTAAQNPYLSLPSADSRGCRYYSFDDAQSIQAKGTFARNNGYGGTIVWTLNQGTNTLTQALKTGFLDP